VPPNTTATRRPKSLPGVFRAGRVGRRIHASRKNKRTNPMEGHVMSKFIYIYKGPATPMDQFTEEQSAAQMAAWGAWMGKLGPALLDAGSPFAAGTSVVDDGTVAEASDLNGYSIVEAENLEAAKALVDGNPFLASRNGKFSVEVFELVDMQM
jgi:hypothetical protein